MKSNQRSPRALSSVFFASLLLCSMQLRTLAQAPASAAAAPAPAVSPGSPQSAPGATGTQAVPATSPQAVPAVAPTAPTPAPHAAAGNGSPALAPTAIPSEPPVPGGESHSTGSQPPSLSVGQQTSSGSPQTSAQKAGPPTPKPTLLVSLDDAIALALQHNHTLLAARTTVQQNEAQEITAHLRPNPTLFLDWEYLPLYNPASFTGTYLHDSTEADIGLSYLLERGDKRNRRFYAARDATAVTRSQVLDSERQLTFQVATLFTNVQIAESTLELATTDLSSFQNTVDIGKLQFEKGAISENDYLKIQLQLLQFQGDVGAAHLARVEALSDLRQLVGYESVPADYDVGGKFDYLAVNVSLEDLQLKALRLRPDLLAANQGITAAQSQVALARANGKQDLTLSTNYSHVNAINTQTLLVSIPLAIFNKNQGEISRTGYVLTQAQQLQQAASGQVLTDVKDAYENFRTADSVITFFRSRYLDISQKSRDISEYSYHRGATSLLDFLDAERTYRSIQLSYRQALSTYLLSVEQLREAVGARSLP